MRWCFEDVGSTLKYGGTFLRFRWLSRIEVRHFRVVASLFEFSSAHFQRSRVIFQCIGGVFKDRAQGLFIDRDDFFNVLVASF